MTEPVSQDVVLLFSGGRDSSLAACRLAAQGRGVRLLTFESGAGWTARDVIALRVEELRAAFPGAIKTHQTIKSLGLFRDIAIQDIEEDFETYGRDLILLGSALTAFTMGLGYCLTHDLDSLASGFTRYQEHFPEQRPEAVEWFRRRARGWNVNYLTPTLEIDSKDDVKQQLVRFQVSTKSLEGMGLFGNSSRPIEAALILRYLDDKWPICEAYLRGLVPPDRRLRVVVGG